MAEKTFNQVFKGYYRENSIKHLPAKSGVYGVYRSVYDSAIDKVALIELIYIGKADDLKVRITTHEDWALWESNLKTGEEICFNYTLVEKIYNERVEAALIYSNQPRLNITYKNNFPFDKTTVICSGRHQFIKVVNVVKRSTGASSKAI